MTESLIHAASEVVVGDFVTSLLPQEPCYPDCTSCSDAGRCLEQYPRAASDGRAFIILRKDEPGAHEGVPVAVYTFDQREACKRDLENKRRVNPDAFYYVLDKPFNPKATS